jgi:hypothetical protein
MPGGFSDDECRCTSCTGPLAAEIEQIEADRVELLRRLLELCKVMPPLKRDEPEPAGEQRICGGSWWV